ncbi:putative hydrolase [Dioscorea sansibarensis]
MFILTQASMGFRIAAILVVVLLGWFYKSFIQPPKPKICGSPNGPPITSPRIQLRDGRHLSYKESGVPKEKAKYKIILIHGFDSTKESILDASQELMEELGIYFLSFDRAGYGESDPNPMRNVKSEAMDIQELADQLHIGSKFYVMGSSIGGFAAWSCLNYIPHRLAGVALVVPAVNYWWPSLPENVTKEVYSKLLVQDQRTFWIAHHVPSLLYAWMNQKLFPSLACLEGNPNIFSKQDKEIVKKRDFEKSMEIQRKARQQGVHESLHRDLMALFSNWEFDPMKISNPFSNNEGSVHLWQGYEDRFVPVEIQRCVVDKLPWIHYHENPEGGHLFPGINGWPDRILKTLLLGQEPASSQ